MKTKIPEGEKGRYWVQSFDDLGFWGRLQVFWWILRWGGYIAWLPTENNPKQIFHAYPRTGLNIIRAVDQSRGT